MGPPALDVLKIAADKSCTSISPLDANPVWTDFDSLPEGRIMGSAIILPDLTTLVINGARYGTAGYGDRGLVSWMTAGSSYAESPTLTPVIYDPKRPVGKRWSSDGLSASTIPRMYHSTAVLLSDGSVFISGSNPNADVFPLDNKYGTASRSFTRHISMLPADLSQPAYPIHCRTVANLSLSTYPLMTFSVIRKTSILSWSHMSVQAARLTLSTSVSEP